MLTSFLAVALAGAGVALATPKTSTAPASTNTINVDQPSQADYNMQIVSDSEIIIDGHTYNSWDAVADSGYYQQHGTRCGVDPLMFEALDIVEPQGTSADCSFSRTNIEAQYNPSVEKYRIPVVVHVIMNTSGTGALSDSRIQSQIDVLNEDFLAIPGTNGAPGTDVQIEFYLEAITRTTNNTWFNDSGTYYNTLAWDTSRYLNIYTNSASGALGYVPDLPQGGIVGSNSDRVVVLYSTFGRNAPLNPFHLGRTTTHEVGHYLGLYHTFQGGCTNSYTSGDRIVDTNPESSPTFGCPGSRTSCGSQAPIDNYMDYSDDVCMEKFTPEQANRMRCTLLHYRPDLYGSAQGPCSGADLVEPYGELDFFDVSGFIVQITNQDPAADLTGDGTIDFFDVSAYLALFAAGCP